LVDPTLTEAGWCRVAGGGAGLEEARFATLDWQAEGADRFIKDGAPPLALRVRVQGIQSDLLFIDERPFGFSNGREPAENPISDRHYNLDLSLRQIPGAGLLVLEAFELGDAFGKWATITAVLDGAYLDTKSSAQSSLAGMTVQQLAAQFALRPDRSEEQLLPTLLLVFDLSAMVSDVLDGLDAQQLPTASRVELAALLDDLPQARGDLYIKARSRNGLGWLQILGANSFNPDATTAEILGFALSGVTLDATWTPLE